MFPLGVTGLIGFTNPKLAPVGNNTAMQRGLSNSTQTQGLTDLPYGDDGYTRLHRLSEEGNLEEITKFLKENPNININQQTELGKTLMSIAIDKKNDDLVNFIAKMENYNPTIPDKYGWTGLHDLTYAGYTNIVKNLLNKYKDFDINMQTNNGDTLMSIAIEKKYGDLVNIIAKIDKKNHTLRNFIEEMNKK